MIIQEKLIELLSIYSLAIFVLIITVKHFLKYVVSGKILICPKFTNNLFKRLFSKRDETLMAKDFPTCNSKLIS